MIKSTEPLGRGAPPGPGLAIEAMSSQLLVGVFSDGRDAATGYLMVVDLRTSMVQGKVPSRTVTLRLSPACRASLVQGGLGGWSELQRNRPLMAADGDATLTLTLHGGGGALLRVVPSESHGGSECGGILRRTRRWFFAPRGLSLKMS